MIVSNDDTCHNPRQDAIGIIRSDFTICSNPADSLDNSCIRGNDNEKDNCGFGYLYAGLLYHEASLTSSAAQTYWDYACTVRIAPLVLLTPVVTPPKLRNAAPASPYQPSPTSRRSRLPLPPTMPPPLLVDPPISPAVLSPVSQSEPSPLSPPSRSASSSAGVASAQRQQTGSASSTDPLRCHLPR